MESEVLLQEAPPAMPTEPLASRFCYRIGSYWLLMESELVAEIISSPAVYPVPFTADWCLGLVSLRGELYPVVDMHRILLGQSSNKDYRLLLIRHPQFPPIVLACDGYPQQLKIPITELQQQLTKKLPSWIPHSLNYEGQVLLVADHARLLRHIQNSTHQQA